MKALVAGSRSMHVLSNGAREALAGLVVQGSHIIVADDNGAELLAQSYLAESGFCDVTVCTSRAEARNNVGGWGVINPSKEKLDLWLPSTLKGEEAQVTACWAESFDVDCGLVFWNGRSYGTFLVALALLALGKPVTVVSPLRVVQAEGLEDLRSAVWGEDGDYRCDAEGLPAEEHCRIVDEFFPSRDMASFLATKQLTKRQLVEIVFNSPVSLRLKYEACERYARYDSPLREVVDDVMERLSESSEPDASERLRIVSFAWDGMVRSSFSVLRDEIGKAQQALRCDDHSFIYRKSVWDEQPELYEQHESGVAPFSDIESALDDLRFEIEDEGWDEDALCWSIFEKWTRRPDGTWTKPYTYCAIRDEIVFFSRNQYVPRLKTWRERRNGGFLWPCEVSVPSPFKAGDIITLDCRPFAPLAHGLVLGDEDARGMSWLLCRQYGTEKRGGRPAWGGGPLRYEAGLHISIPGYSPLYRAEVFSGALPEAERVLLEVQRWLGSDKSRARKLDKALHEAGGMDDDALRAFIAKEG